MISIHVPQGWRFERSARRTDGTYAVMMISEAGDTALSISITLEFAIFDCVETAQEIEFENQGERRRYVWTEERINEVWEQAVKKIPVLDDSKLNSFEVTLA